MHPSTTPIQKGLAKPPALVYFLAPFWKISLGCAVDFVSPHMNKKAIPSKHALES